MDKINKDIKVGHRAYFFYWSILKDVLKKLYEDILWKIFISSQEKLKKIALAYKNLLSYKDLLSYKNLLNEKLLWVHKNL